MTKILYQEKIRFLSFTCEDITVVRATSVSANRKRASQHHFLEIYMPHCYNVLNTYKRYLFSLFSTKIRMCVRSIFYQIDSTNKGLVQEIVMLVFHRCLYNKQKITWPLGDRTFISSRVKKYFMSERSERVKYVSTLEDKWRVSARPCNIFYLSYFLKWKNRFNSRSDLV